VRAFIALPGTALLSDDADARAAESFVDSALLSFCADSSDSVSFSFSLTRRVFSLESCAISFFIAVRSDVRDCRAETCCFRALITAS
jgi:hypothetical protein